MIFGRWSNGRWVLGRAWVTLEVQGRTGRGRTGVPVGPLEPTTEDCRSAGSAEGSWVRRSVYLWFRRPSRTRVSRTSPKNVSGERVESRVSGGKVLLTLRTVLVTTGVVGSEVP